MTRRATSRIRTGLWVALLAMSFTTAPAVAHARPATVGGSGQESRAVRAARALEAAEALFRPRSPEGTLRGLSATRTGGASIEATQVLRELALNLDRLDPSEREAASRILARPTDGFDDPGPGVKYGDAPRTSTCTGDTAPEAHVCLHWVTEETDPNAPPAGDEDTDGIPDWVRVNERVLEEVWGAIVDDLGYRPPLSDLETRDPGPDSRLDVYLADLRPYGLYGYCVPELPLRGRAASAYCVVDNDFERYSGTPLADLEVTVAHEFFHAVQFGYSVLADLWLMEGTAAWVEDEVYDAIDDNLQYLPGSALQHPGVPLDYVGGDPAQVYGSWIWWRFLSEYFGHAGSADRSVVRQVWQHVGGGQGTLAALRQVLRQRASSFGGVFADFGAANTMVRRWYDEGRHYADFVAPVAGRFVLTSTRPRTPWLQTRLGHLSTRTVVFVPGRSLRGRRALTMLLDLPPRFRGSRATVVVHRRDGTIRWIRTVLNGDGDARLRVPFTRRYVAHVALSLTNASTRIANCGSTTGWSCNGVPLDDGPQQSGLPFAFQVGTRP